MRSPVGASLLAVVAFFPACAEPTWPAPPDSGVIARPMDATTGTPDTGATTPADGGVLGPDAGTFLTWYNDVEPILAQHCFLCHASPPRFGATRSLLNWDDTQITGGDGRHVHDLMAARVSAPTHRMPPPSRPPLSPDEIATIVEWSRGGAPRGSPNVPPPTWYDDVQPLMAQRCVFCHMAPPRFSAPMALVTYEHLTAIHATSREPMYQLVSFRMGTGSMPPFGQPPATAEEIAMIQAWAQAGAPLGTPPPDAGVSDDGGEPGDQDAGPGVPWRDGGTSPSPAPGLRWVETYARDPAGGPYEAPVGETLYSCWAFPVTTSTHAIAGNDEFGVYFEPILDNLSNLHHMMLFVDYGGDLTGQVEGPFSCLGFPTRSRGGYPDMIGGWFPAREPHHMPDGVGVRLRPGDRIILQNHYDRVTAPGMFDESGIRVLMDSREPMETAGTLWNGVIWNGPLNGDNETRTGSCIITEPFSIFQSFPHMHQYGRRIVSSVRRAGTQNWITVAEISPWNFEDQPIIDVPGGAMQLNPGDELRTQCWWDTEGRTVYQGDGSLDEMCFTTFYVYPALANGDPGGPCVQHVSP